EGAELAGDVAEALVDGVESLLGRLRGLRVRARGLHALLDAGQPLLDRLQPRLECARPGHGREPLVDAIDAVLDGPETLRDRPHPPGEPLHVRRGWDVERPHGDLLRLRGLLTRLHGPPDR